MSLSDLKISKYEKDLKKYKREINKLSNAKGQQICGQLLKNIEHEMSIIRNNHDSRNGGYMNPLFVRENVVKLAKLRLKLEKLLKQLKGT